MREKTVRAAGNHKGFVPASDELRHLAELKIAPMQVARVAHETGREMVAARDERAERHRRGELPVDAGQPPVEIACVEVDGGRLQVRAAGNGRGVHGHRWRETKIAALWRMTGPTFAEDPSPDPPPAFLEFENARRLAREIARHSGGGEDDEPTHDEPAHDSPGEAERGPRPETGPRRVFRTCVATLRDVHAFGPLVAAEAWRRGFHHAPRQAFLGDGSHANWTVHRLHFPHFVPIVDCVHGLTYVFAAAGAVTASRAAHEEQHRQWLTDVWQGRVGQVIAELTRWRERLGPPPENPPPDDPREVVRRTLVYLENNRDRMNYPEYRRRGLPVTSSLIESLIKEFNGRMKGTEKFWNDPDGAEALLQVRAALLDDGDPLHQHLRHRTPSPFNPRRTPR